MKVKLFTRKDCPKCPSAKQICQELEKEGITIEYYDTDTVDGMAEGAFYSVMSTPTTVVVNSEDEELKSWRGKPPDKEAILLLK